jgi:hypothetical protein
MGALLKFFFFFGRTCFRGQLVECLFHGLALFARPFEDGRPTPDRVILFADTRRSSSGNPLGNAGLEWKFHNVTIREEIEEEIVHVIQSFRTTHVGQQNRSRPISKKY